MKTFFALLFLACALLLQVPGQAAATDQTTEAVASVATVNINTASMEELLSLPGIGKVTAERIVAYRTEQGLFASPDDLVKVKGVGPKSLAKIRELIRTE